MSSTKEFQETSAALLKMAFSVKLSCYIKRWNIDLNVFFTSFQAMSVNVQGSEPSIFLSFPFRSSTTPPTFKNQIFYFATTYQ